MRYQMLQSIPDCDFSVYQRQYWYDNSDLFTTYSSYSETLRTFWREKRVSLNFCSLCASDI